MSSNKIISTLPLNEPLTIIDKVNGYYRVISSYSRGWISEKEVDLYSQQPTYPQTIMFSTNYETEVKSGFNPSNTVVGKLNFNEEVNVIDLKNGYFRIIGEKIRGWVHHSNLSDTTSEIYYSGGQMYAEINKDSAKLKNGFLESNPTIQLLDKKTPITIIDESNNFYRVITPVSRGWISINDVNLLINEPTYLPWDGYVKNDINVSDDFDASSSTIGSIIKGTKVKIINMKNNFYQVVSGNLNGWVQSSYIQTDPLTSEEISLFTSGVVTASSLNMRSGPSTSYATIDSIPHNTEVRIFGQDPDSNWYKIEFKNVIGYVSNSFIALNAPLNPKSYKEIDLRTESIVTAQQINDYISKYEKYSGKISKFSGLGQTFINIGKQYGVNQLFLAAIAVHESSYGTSYIGTRKNNFFGLGAYDIAPFDAAYYFPTVQSGIEYQAAFLRKYYLENTDYRYKGAYLGDGSGGLNYYYASDKLWGQKIANHMNNILPYADETYRNAQVMNVATPSTSIPDYTEKLPNNIVAKSNSNLTIYSAKNGTSVGSLPKGEFFAISEKTNDYWFKVRYNSNNYWIRPSVSNYSSQYNILNLVRIQVDQGPLNVRSGPSTGYSIIGNVNDFTYLQGVLDSSNVLQQQNGWYKVQLSDGQQGWISSQYARLVFP
ncbi:SH3 domain-containing protein [Bacillus coahuilensis]|uniref:SH3 domain-containing protein n=1 Tax=Bacillus coahuilensis TaxID=408580 RepID=UPI0007505C08|nr:SH3 domain-containing protein [Bacillus coahuilensis]